MQDAKTARSQQIADHNRQLDAHLFQQTLDLTLYAYPVACELKFHPGQVAPEDDQLLREGRERSDPSGRQIRIDTLRTGQLDQDTSPTPHDRYGSDDLHRVDLRSPASVCGKGQGSKSSDVAGDRSSEEEERRERCEQDRRLPALRFPARVLYGFHRDKEPASDPSLPKPCAKADDPDEEPYFWPADGDWRELQQTAAAQAGLLHGADVVQ